MNSPSSEYTSLSQIKTPGYYWVNVGKFKDNPFDGSSGSALLHVLNQVSIDLITFHFDHTEFDLLRTSKFV